MVKIAICIPLGDYMPCEFLPSFTRMLSKIFNKTNYGIEIQYDTTVPLDKSRNLLVKASLAKKVDYIWFIDSDMVIGEDTLDSLLSMNADIASAIYFNKAQPNLPVIRKREHGLWWNVEEVPLGTIVETDGVGMGCCLIKTDVFKNIEMPWFKFDWKNYDDMKQVSEDLYFCGKARDKGYKVLVNTGTIVGHVGGMVSHQNYLHYQPKVREYVKHRDTAVLDLMSYFDIYKVDVVKNLQHGAEMVRDDWNKANPKTEEEIKNFYKTNKNYIYDLVNWHLTTRRTFDETMVEELKGMKAKRVLDFGCGTGDNAIIIAKAGMEVVAGDLDGEVLKFLKYRIERHNIKNITTWKMDREELKDDKFDAVLCFDVLEHLTDDEFKRVSDRLRSYKAKGARIFITSTFGKTELYPQHFIGSQYKKEVIEELAGANQTYK